MAILDKDHKRDKSVLAIFQTDAQARDAVSQLRMEGFSDADISAIAPKGVNTAKLGVEKETKAPEGVTTGATTGGVVGGALGFLAGVGALAIPGLGPLIAAGPIMATLAGLGAGAALGGIAGGLIGLGIPEDEAKKYENFVKEGNILLAVHTDTADLEKRANEILDACGGREVAAVGKKEAKVDTSERREDFAGDVRERDRPQTDARLATDATVMSDHTTARAIPVRNEDDRTVPPPL